LEQRLRSQSDLIAAIQANLKHEHASVEQVKDQLNGQLTNLQALRADPQKFAAVQAQQTQEVRDLQQSQRHQIEELQRTLGDVRRQLEEVQDGETKNANALREVQQKSPAAGSASAAHSTFSKGRPEGHDREPTQYDRIEFPTDWTARFSRQELIDSAREADKWLQLTKSVFKHAWRGYHDRAWGQDEFKPVTGSPGRKWANCGLQILDALSTMWIMGMREEFDEAEKWIDSTMRLDSPGLVSVFEITIRGLGGLVSAHSLSGREVFLRKAKELADRLLPAFSSDTGFPTTQVDLKTGDRKKGWYSGTVLAEAGTLQLEFRYVSQLTGDPKYAERADKSMRAVMQASNGKGLVPWGLSQAGSGTARAQNNHITFGAIGDSYYEYLLKVWLQTAKTEPIWKDTWKQAMKEMQQRLVLRTNAGLTYVAEENNGRITHKMDHLACFVGGMLVYGSRMLPEAEVDQAWERNAAEITETCYQMYFRYPSHLAPECVSLQPNAAAGQDMVVWNNAAHYLLRPEAAEAIFYMHYYTGDPKYRRMAGLIIEAIEAHAKTEYGYSAVADVRQENPRQKNEMETFFIAETLKYLYLTFVPNPRTVLDLDEFVLNTEAHPIRIFRPKGSGAFLNKGRTGR
jgi:mannosyl-oligosaccharide alpha-1,2-mannosidase